MQTTWLQWGPDMDAYTTSKRTWYDKKEIDLPLFYKPKFVNDEGEKVDVPTEEVLSWAEAHARKNGYGHLITFIRSVVAGYDEWRW
jgi:hypothetical protein